MYNRFISKNSESIPIVNKLVQLPESDIITKVEIIEKIGQATSTVHYLNEYIIIYRTFWKCL
jgi:hypothetical protein